MGRLGKQLKRKKEVAIKKIVYRETEKQVKAESRGQTIARQNLGRMEAYQKCYMMTCFAYVMHKTFGMGHDKILTMVRKLDEYDEYYTTKEKWRCKVSWFKAGLYIECKGFRIPFKNEMKEPPSFDDVGWCTYYVHNSFLMGARAMYTTFFWVLHDVWGFNHKRLERAKEELLKLTHLSWNEFAALWDELKKMKYPKAKDANCLNPERVMECIKQLIDPNTPPDEEMAYKVRNIAIRRPAA